MLFLTQNLQNILAIGLLLLGTIAAGMVFIISKLSHIQSSLDELSVNKEKDKRLNRDLGI